MTRYLYQKLKDKSSSSYFKSRINIFDSNPTLLNHLILIVNSHPAYYLDQFVEHLFDLSGVLVSPSTIYRVLNDRLGYRLLKVQELAENCDEDERDL